MEWGHEVNNVVIAGGMTHTGWDMEKRRARKKQTTETWNANILQVSACQIFQWRWKINGNISHVKRFVRYSPRIAWYLFFAGYINWNFDQLNGWPVPLKTNPVWVYISPNSELVIQCSNTKVWCYTMLIYDYYLEILHCIKQSDATQFWKTALYHSTCVSVDSSWTRKSKNCKNSKSKWKGEFLLWQIYSTCPRLSQDYYLRQLQQQNDGEW